MTLHARIQQARDSVVELVKAHPLPATAIAFALGFAAGGGYKLASRSRNPVVRTAVEGLLAGALGVLGKAAQERLATQARTWFGIEVPPPTPN